MARRRFVVEEIRQDRATLRGQEARHLTRVLRAQIGQRFEVSDNRSLYLAEVAALGKDQVSFRILEPLASEEPPVRLALFVSPIKFDRFAWILEKALQNAAQYRYFLEEQPGTAAVAVSAVLTSA